MQVGFSPFLELESIEVRFYIRPVSDLIVAKDMIRPTDLLVYWI